MSDNDPDDLRARREQMLLRLLMRLTRSMTDETIRRVQARGHHHQPSYLRLLGNLDAQGTRIGALARRMGTTRQAASQLLQEIERQGFVERRDDPGDQPGV